MQCSLKTDALPGAKTSCIVLPVSSDGNLSSANLPKNSAQALQKIIKAGDLGEATGSVLLVHAITGLVAERVLLVRIANKKEMTLTAARKAMNAVAMALHTYNQSDVGIVLEDWAIPTLTPELVLRHWVLVIAQRYGQYDQLKSTKKKSATKLNHVYFFTAQATAALKQSVVQAQAIATGIHLTRTLGNLPANICTPAYLGDTAKDLGKRLGLKVQVLERTQIEKLGMNCFLSVTNGSVLPPKFIIAEYNGGKKNTAPIILVGKGITFDTGGISLKPAPDMDEMKFDMCGAASVLGTLEAIATMKLPLNVVGLIPTCENMPSGTATRPGDIVKTMSGQTVEILNTDAEGRLILCDALTYAARYKPKYVIDIATLTGACVIALGHVVSGFYCTDDTLAEAIKTAGDQTYDRVWQLPLHDEYQQQLDSNFADMANIGSRAGGSITAACFLKRFTKEYAWGHLDIAGTANLSGKEKGATGRPVPLLTEFLIRQAN